MFPRKHWCLCRISVKKAYSSKGLDETIFGGVAKESAIVFPFCSHDHLSGSNYLIALEQGCQTQIHMGPKLRTGRKLRARLDIY